MLLLLEKQLVEMHLVRIVAGQRVADSHEGRVMPLRHIILRWHHHSRCPALGRRTHPALRLATRERLMTHAQAWWAIKRRLGLLPWHETHKIVSRLLLHGCSMHRRLLLLVLQQKMRGSNTSDSLTQGEGWVGTLNLGVVVVHELLDHLD